MESLSDEALSEIAGHLHQAFRDGKGLPGYSLHPSATYIRGVHQSIQRREIPLCDLALKMHYRRQTLLKLFAQFGLPIRVSIGRPPDPNLEEFRRRITWLREAEGLKVGSKRTAISIVPDNYLPPFHAVYSILHPQPVKIHHPLNQYNHRFHAKYTHYIWHTDLHQMGPGVDANGITNIIYMIAFIDDASRYMMGYQLITDKISETCAMVLRMILMNVQSPPYIIGSDNGGEFRGPPFTNLLNEFQIRPWYGQS
jgi:hypothetical protein